jgi:hypothetical protein
MFKFLKKTPDTWIDQPVIDYLLGISQLYVIYYAVESNGNRIYFRFRDEQGNLLADIHDTRVKELILCYQEDFIRHSYYVDNKLGADELPKIMAFFEKKMQAYPTSKSRLTLTQLGQIQAQFKQQLEDTLQVPTFEFFPEAKGIEDNDIHVHFNSLDPDERERFIRFLNRLDANCLDVVVNIHLNHSTEEEIGATQTELDMMELEAEEEERE